MGIVNSVNMAFSEEDPSANQGREEIEDSNETKEEEESEECPVCKYIKEGECKRSFIALEKCVEEENEEKATKCKELRKIFKTCMFENSVYYKPVIEFEAEVVANMISELHAEKEAILAGDAVAIAKALSKLQTTEEEPVFPAEIEAIAKAFQDLEADKKEIAKGNESDHQPQS